MKTLGNLFLLAVIGFFALGIFGGACSYKLDSSRPKDANAYSYYVDRLNATDGAERAKVALAYEWAEVTGEISESEYEALETLYKSLREG